MSKGGLMKRIIPVIIFVCAVFVGIVLLSSSSDEEQPPAPADMGVAVVKTVSTAPGANEFEFADSASVDTQQDADSENVAEDSTQEDNTNDNSSEPEEPRQLVRGDSSVLELTPEQIEEKYSQKPAKSDNHAEVIDTLTDSDKMVLRSKVNGMPDSDAVRSVGVKDGYPLTNMGPIVIKAPADTPIHLTALDLGQFVNGERDVFVRTGADGMARVDFRLGQSAGGYRVLVRIPGYEDKQLFYDCIAK